MVVTLTRITLNKEGIAYYTGVAFPAKSPIVIELYADLSIEFIGIRAVSMHPVPHPLTLAIHRETGVYTLATKLLRQRDIHKTIRLLSLVRDPWVASGPYQIFLRAAWLPYI